MLLLAGLVGLFAQGLIENETTVAAMVKDGKHPFAPDFTLDQLDGTPFTLSSTVGRPVIMNFWASWCDACKDEAPALAQVARSHQGQAVVIGVNSQDLPGDARAFADNYGLDFPLPRDGDGDVYRRWGLTGMPETFVLDARGRVVRHFPYQITARDLEGALAPLLENG